MIEVYFWSLVHLFIFIFNLYEVKKTFKNSLLIVSDESCCQEFWATKIIGFYYLKLGVFCFTVSIEKNT